MSDLGGLTANCAEGRHDTCRCLLPGQDRRYAGLIVEWDEKHEAFRPAGICSCPCHDGERPAP